MLPSVNRIGLVLVMTLLLGGGCSAEPAQPRSTQEPKNVLHAEVGSYDIAAGEESRVVIGLFTGDQLFVSYGNVDLVFSFLGDADQPQSPQPGPSVTGRFLPVPGMELPAELPAEPIAAPASRGRGVYTADVEFDRPGTWQVGVTATVERRGRMRATAAFEVLEEHRIPAPGDPALATDNLTRRSLDAPREAVDSRWGPGEELPDPELHETTIADAVEAGRPAVVVFSTPVYCVSRFCGPVTEMVEELAHKYGDRAEFIHVEIWRNYQGGVINEAAADWLLRDNDLREPWVFFIGADGRIQARWDNVATREEIEPLLKDLLAFRAAGS